MKDILNNYLAYLQNELNYSEHTCISYKNDILIFNDYILREGIEFRDVDYFSIRYYIVNLSKLQYSKNTIRRNLSALSSFFNYLAINNIVDQNPVTLVDSIKKDKLLPDFLFVEEVKKLIVACNDRKFKNRDKMIIMLLFYNGLRVSELVGITLDDIKKNRVKVLGKGNIQRYAVLNNSVLKILDDYLKYERREVTSHNYLLINNKYQPLTDRGVRYIVNEIAKASSLEKNVYPHMLRHSFATYFLTHGSDLRTVQTFLGHKNISTTQIYTHLTTDHIKEAHQKFHPRSKKKD